MDLEFKNSKDKKNILFVFRDCYFYNGEKYFSHSQMHKTLNLKKYLIYNYFNHIFITTYINEKAFGIEFEYKTKDDNKYFNLKSGNIE